MLALQKKNKRCPTTVITLALLIITTPTTTMFAMAHTAQETSIVRATIAQGVFANQRLRHGLSF